MLIPVFSLSNGKVVFNGSSLPIEPFALAEKYSMLGDFVIDPQVRDNEEDKKLIVQIIKQLGSCRVVVHDHATALFYLNLGATKVVIDPSTPQDSLAEMFSSLPKERLIVSLDGASGAEDRINALKEIASEFLVPFQGDLSSHLDLIKKLVSVVGKQGHIIVSGASTPEIIAQLDKTNVAVQSDLGDDKLSIEASLIAHLVTDRPDGLYTTVVVDEQGVSLGLVYSSKESISEAIRLKRGVYYSRSRKSIWYKGDTSGDTQKLLRIEVDCDGDALKFVVGQGGDGFCHLKTRSCFSDVDVGLGALMRTLESRKTSAPEGSYTKRLFEDSDLLRAKLVEEANELADAQTKDEVTGETADVIFFALVAAAKAGVTLADVERELDRRSLKVQRRPGDSKPHIVSLLQEQDRLKGLKKAEKTLTQ